MTGQNLPIPSDGATVGLTGESAEVVRTQANEARTDLMRRKLAADKQLADMKAQLEAQRAEIEAAFRRQAADLEAQVAPLRAELKKMAEVIETVDLYLGRSEQMTLLRDGEPAPADEPITIRQSVLAADEESLVLIDSGGVDARSMDAFCDWVAASVENTTRILPEPRCVVAVVPSRRHRDYGDPWTTGMMNQANAHTHWLFRNGEKLWVMVTDFTAGQVILPRRDEFVDLFYERAPFTHETRPLVPGSDRWLKAEEVAGARKRHYLKIGMILQGVIDRTACFHPLPEGGVNLLSVAAQDTGQVRMVNELDLALTDGRESFRDWQARLTAELQVGMRIVGAFGRYGDEQSFHDLYVDGDRWSRGHHPRLHPGNAEYPATGEVYPIEDRKPNGDLVFRYRRTEKIEKRNIPVPDEPGWVYPWGMVEPKQRASCVVRAGDRWILPYDLATIDDLTYYLNHREARKNYMAMVPVIRAALEAKQAEREAEAPFRALLVGTLAADHNLDTEEVERLLPDVIDRWKLGNKHHRALTGDPAHEAKALRGVRAEFAATRNARTADAVPAAVDKVVRGQFGDRLLAVLAKRDGTFLAVARTETPDLYGNGWVDTMAVTKTGITRPVTTWTTIPARTRSRATVVWQHPDWQTWTAADPALHATGPELAAQADVMRAWVAERAAGDLLAVTYREGKGYGYARGRTMQAVCRVDGHLKTWVSMWTRTSDGTLAWTTPTDGRTTSRYITTVTVASVEYTGEFPWIGADDEYAADRTRPRLLWVDPDVFGAWQAGVAAEEAEAEAKRAARETENTARHDWIQNRYEPAFEAHLDARAKAAFLAEYGLDAEDLWAHHKTTLNLNQTRRFVNDLLHRVGWRDAAGHTVDELATKNMPPLAAGFRYPTLADDEEGLS